MNNLENFSKTRNVNKKWIWEMFYIVRMIKWKFKILNRRLKEQWAIERIQLTKSEKMVDAGKHHLYDQFEDFLVEASNVLEADARESAVCANKRFGTNFTKDWFRNFDTNCGKNFSDWGGSRPRSIGVQYAAKSVRLVGC
jgi:hypothetical protein